MFAWGAGIFFIGYFIFEVPSNLALEKFGASRWIARIMVTWGIISALMALVSGDWSFYGLRFLLGVAEAGFFPGIILYLTYWYPAEYRARFLAAFAIAVPVSDGDRRAGLGLSARARRRDGTEGLAMAVRHRGHPVGAARHRHLVLSHRPAGAGRLADRRAEGVAVPKLESEVAAKKAAQHHDAWAGTELAAG